MLLFSVGSKVKYFETPYYSRHKNESNNNLFWTECIEHLLMYLYFQYFIHQFRELMNDPNTGTKELSLAIRGYGLLAAVSTIDTFSCMCT